MIPGVIFHLTHHHPTPRLLSPQSHPASLKLLIEAEGEQLLLALEKNE